LHTLCHLLSRVSNAQTRLYFARTTFHIHRHFSGLPTIPFFRTGKHKRKPWVVMLPCLDVRIWTLGRCQRSLPEGSCFLFTIHEPFGPSWSFLLQASRDPFVTSRFVLRTIIKAKRPYSHTALSNFWARTVCAAQPSRGDSLAPIAGYSSQS
jgi:hypothetical protein